MSPGDVIVIIDPRFDDFWKQVMRLHLAYQINGDGDAGGMLIFMISQFEESFRLKGSRRGKMSTVRVYYFLKTVTNGHAFYSYLGSWRTAGLELLYLDLEDLATSEEDPMMRTVAHVVCFKSNSRYGGICKSGNVYGFGDSR